MNSYINYEPGQTVFALYDNNTNQIIMIHPILYIIDKMSIILSGKLPAKICRLKVLDKMNSESCHEYTIGNFTEPTHTLDSIRDRNIIAEQEPVVMTERRVASELTTSNKVSPFNGGLPIDRAFLKYIIFNIEQSWYHSLGRFAPGNISYTKSFNQVLDLYLSDDRLKAFLSYDIQCHWKVMEAARLTTSLICHACLLSKSIIELRAKLYIIAKSGDIVWEI